MKKKAIPNSLVPRARKQKTPKPQPKKIEPAVEPTVADEPEVGAPVVEAVQKETTKPVSEKKAAPKKEETKPKVSLADTPAAEKTRFNFYIDKRLHKKMKYHCMEAEISATKYLENLIIKDLGLE